MGTLVQWNSVNKSTSGQPVLDLIRGGFNKRRFSKMHKNVVFFQYLFDTEKICVQKFN